MEKDNLGVIIYRTLKNFYPYDNIGIQPDDIQGILEKAGINKKNSKKEEIAKIIRILKHHIEIAKSEPPKIVAPPKYSPVFPELDKDNSYLEDMRIKHFDNIAKLREDELNKVENDRDIIPQELRVKNFMEEERNEFEHRIIIDSKDRDFDAHPKPNEYTISLGIPHIPFDKEVKEKKGYLTRNYQDVVSIELLQVVIRDTSSVSNASDNPDVPAYLLIEIEEVGSIYEGTNQALSKSFAKLQYYELSDHGSTKYRNYAIGEEEFKKIFKPRRNLNRLTIRILNIDGELYSFGDDVDSSSVSYNSFIFKIVTLQKNFVSTFIDKTN